MSQPTQMHKMSLLEKLDYLIDEFEEIKKLIKQSEKRMIEYSNGIDIILERLK